MADYISRDFYQPEGVTGYVGLGVDSFVGAVDQTTVLKYPKSPGDETALSILKIEADILQAIGPSKYIIGFKGLREDGLLLERAPRGSIEQFLGNQTITDKRKLTWARQASEAVAATHNARVIHCDIHVNNLLLDNNLNVKLCDFQGLLLNPDGSINKNGLSKEKTKSFMPRNNNDYADQKTDIFALGSALYYIMQGHEPFPDLNSKDDEDEIMRRFTIGQFPRLQSVLMNNVTHKCWAGNYESANAILQDLAS